LYYQALAFSRSGKKNEALPLLEKVTDNAPIAYRARALQSSGAIHQWKGQIDEALRFYPEAMRAASPEIGRDLLTTLRVYLEISGIKSGDGDHRGALSILERVSPLVQIVASQTPLCFYLYHNELAIELAESGRIAEAEAACAIALASPFAPAYPEWSETREEIAAKRLSATPSFVAVNRAIKADSSQQAELECQPQQSKALAFSRLAVKKLFVQRSSIAVVATAANGCVTR
jgi:tetratricopeptide (TPR) repeat protein